MSVRYRIPTRAGVIGRVIQRVNRVPLAREIPTDPRERALYLEEKRARELSLKRWKEQGSSQIRHGRMPPSSWVDELVYHELEHKVWAKMGGVWYTYSNVPETIFANWKQGRADCITDDTGRVKRWIVGKTPSVGAYFHVRIKGKYPFVRGRV